MNIQKTIIVFLIALLLIHSLTGCSSQKLPVEETSSRIFLDYAKPTLTDSKVITTAGYSLSLSANEQYLPSNITKEQFNERINTLKEKYSNFSDRELAALLVANCSYMKSEDFNFYVSEYFGSSYVLMKKCGEYQQHKYLYAFDNFNNTSSDVEYSSLVSLDELYFDEYLIYQANEIEARIQDIIFAYRNNLNPENAFAFFYNYMTYQKVDSLIFMRGDTRLTGNGLILLEYVTDQFAAWFIRNYCADFISEGVPSSLSELMGKETDYSIFTVQEDLIYAETTARTDTERILTDEVTRILKE